TWQDSARFLPDGKVLLNKSKVKATPRAANKFPAQINLGNGVICKLDSVSEDGKTATYSCHDFGTTGKGGGGGGGKGGGGEGGGGGGEGDGKPGAVTADRP